jgi:hypothetical protein
MNEQQELLEALDDISRALDDMRRAEVVLGDYLKRHKEDRHLLDEEGKGDRYRAVNTIHEAVVDVMSYEDEVGSLYDSLSEELEGGR